MSLTSTGGISTIVHVACDLFIAHFESVGNIFTGLGLLTEMNQQLGEERPRRLSRFVRSNLFLKNDFF